MIIRRAAPILLALPAATLLAACAVAPPPLAPPGAAAPPPSLWGPRGKNELDDQMLAIAQAEDDIDRLFPHAGKPPSLASRKKAADKGEGAADRDRKEDEAKQMSAEGADPCAVACRALSSMNKSADHLCKLAGEGDGRCEDARGRVRGATARVRAVCPACAGASSAPQAPR